MQAFPTLKIALAGAFVCLLAGCQLATEGGSGFQKEYSVARTALEEGKFDRASRSYARLLEQSGPLRPRIQLEYAHSELRAGRFEKAAELAGELTRSQKGQDRAAALAVLGTAQHELGLAQLQNGNASTGKRYLQTAEVALNDVLKSHPQLDPLGSLAGRRASIKARLKRL
ncbi:MAG: tetratricopeptide repeat protein [Thalassovita sp.]